MSVSLLPETEAKAMVRQMDRSPYLFIVGCARSGTTLLQRMLDHHPLLAVANEARLMLRIADNGNDGINPPLTPKLVEEVRSHPRFAKLHLSDAAIDQAAAQASRYGEFVSALYSEYGKLYGKALVGEKTPRYVRHLPLIYQVFPWVKTVHIIRDGRDVALSTLQWAREGRKGPGRFQLWRQQPLATCALWWAWQVRTGRLDGSALGADRYNEVKYEELVRRPEETLRLVTGFLSLPFAAEMLSYHQGRARTQTGLSSKRAWLPPTSGLRDWRTQMKEQDVELFEALAGDLLSALGYERVFKAVSPEITKVAKQCRNWWETEMAARAA